MLSEDFDEAFLTDDYPFAESIVYSANGVESTIKAVVKRGGLVANKSKADNTKSLYDYELIVSITDITKVTLNKDTVTIDSPQYGGTNICVVAGILGKTPMCWYLGLRG
jgi:hypothetical protein